MRFWIGELVPSSQKAQVSTISCSSGRQLPHSELGKISNYQNVPNYPDANSHIQNLGSFRQPPSNQLSIQNSHIQNFLDNLSQIIKMFQIIWMQIIWVPTPTFRTWEDSFRQPHSNQLSVQNSPIQNFLDNLSQIIKTFQIIWMQII